jgi:uncharacterized protein (UPF0305 family)
MSIRNIIEELDRYIPESSKHQLIENRANNILHALINLKEDIKKCFTPEEADELVRRIDNSVRCDDPRKFTRKIREYKENSRKGPKFLD